MVSYTDYFSDQKRAQEKELMTSITMSTCSLIGRNNKSPVV